jgi:4-amino-4-deoxy-L-arabinose transferase-like glycosyltransferase
MTQSASRTETPISDDSSAQAQKEGHARWTWPILLLLMVVNTLGSIYWVKTNIVMVGHDATSYLETSIKYAHFFTGFSPSHWFQAITFPDYRTPAIYIATLPFLHLFGIDMDGAQMLNIALLPLTVLVTYFLGKRVAGSTVGLFAAALIGFLPMMAAMARLYYVEILLTVVVSFNLLALFKTDRFTNRSWSLIWGVTLGFGLLVKWTLPMYLLFPVLWVIWKSDLVHEQIAWLRKPSVNLKALGIAVLVGTAIALLWFWPNREAVLEFPLGNWILPAWALLATLSVYAIIIPSTRLSNGWASILLAAAIASLWYFPYIDFPIKLLVIDKERAPEGAGALNLSNYTRYFSFFYREHLGALTFWLIIPVGLFPWLRVWSRRSTLNRDATVLWLSILSAYIVLSIILQHNARNLVPILPQLSILLAIGLRAYSQRNTRIIGAVWLSLLIVQWSLFTFQPLAHTFAASKPLWANSNYVVSPAGGPTDPAYWIAPDVLATIGDPDKDGDPDSLGILVETWEVHRGIFRYLATRAKQNLTIMSLTEHDSRGWSDVLANRWLLINEGDNSEVGEPGQRVIERIANGDPLFHQLYHPVKQYPIPSGDTITLYQRTAGPSQPLDFPVVLIETAAIADAINAQSSPAATLFFSNPDIAAWVGIHDLSTEQVIVAEAGMEQREEAQSLFENTTGTLLVATRYDASETLKALQAVSYAVSESGDGDFHLTTVGRPSRETVTLPVTADWEEIHITKLTGYDTASPGEVLPIDMAVEGRTDGSLKMSMRLVDPNDRTVAQHDVTLTPDIKLGLLVPPDSDDGIYTIAAVVYDAHTVEPLLDDSGSQVGSLSEITVSDSHLRQK